MRQIRRRRQQCSKVSVSSIVVAKELIVAVAIFWNYYHITRKNHPLFLFFREVGVIAKELQAANKLLNQLEAAVEAEKANRHNLLKQCKMESINVPMKKGRLDEIDDDGDDPSIEVSPTRDQTCSKYVSRGPVFSKEPLRNCIFRKLSWPIILSCF